MKKINLTTQEIDVIKKHLDGGLGWDTTVQDVEIMNGLIEKAEALQDELDAIDEVMDTDNCDLIAWLLQQVQRARKDLIPIRVRGGRNVPISPFFVKKQQ